MKNEFLLFRLRLSILRNLIRRLRSESRLKSVVIGCFALGFWVLMFAMFYDVFRFLNKFEGVKVVLLDYLFAFFFLALFVMMTISNGIISYASLFRSSESEYLLSLPVRQSLIFSYKSLESLVFSSWGLITIIVPMIVAYGLTTRVSVLFYPATIVFSFVFVFLPTALGSTFSLLITRYFPRKRRAMLITAAAVCVVLAVLFGSRLFQHADRDMFSEGEVHNILNRISFVQFWLLPSRWVANGILAAARGDARNTLFFLLVLLSNAMLLIMVSGKLGGLFYGRAWGLAQSHGGRRYFRHEGILDRALMKSLFFIPTNMRYLVRKDLKTFLRDPAQWSQCLLFFGLLALYILNLPRIHRLLDHAYWRSLVAFLNLAATCLTLSTFTSRFVFPQLSLEGRRFWILGLLPIEHRTILLGKFFFSAAGALLISGALILASDIVLSLPVMMIVMHLFVVVVCCCGLSGLAVGLGALYPDLRSENPSKIVSSFGGTLNLVLSIGFVGVTIGLAALPMTAYGRGGLTGWQFSLILLVVIAAEVVIGLIVTLLPLSAGLKAFNRMEF